MEMTDREVEMWKMGYESAIAELRAINAIRDKGKWEIKSGNAYLVCSKCGFNEGKSGYDYCPVCGSKMKK